MTDYSRTITEKIGINLNKTVLCLPFDEGTGSIAHDVSGNNNDGTIVGATWVDGKIGKALSFDGTDYVGSIGSASFWQSLGEKTIAVWIYPTSFGVQEQILGNRNDSNSPPIGFGFGLTASGNLMTWTYPWVDVVSVLSPTLNAWNFVAMTHAGTTITFYLNGQSDTYTSVNPPSLGGGVLAIGQGGDAYPSERFSGIIDEVRIFNRALSADEVSILYVSSSFFPSLISRTKIAYRLFTENIGFKDTRFRAKHIIRIFLEKLGAYQNVLGVYNWIRRRFKEYPRQEIINESR